MTTAGSSERPVLYVIVCAAPPALTVEELVRGAREDGWDVHVVATPDAAEWVDRDLLEGASGHPVRSAYRTPDEPKTLPEPDALVAAPATFNTVNKLRYGIADNLAVGLLCEYLLAGPPIVLAPNVADRLVAHPAFAESLALLRDWGVHVMEQSEQDREDRMPVWAEVLDEVRRVTRP